MTEESESALHQLKAGVPQGSVLGLMLSLLYTADIPTTNKTITTFSQDTVI